MKSKNLSDLLSKSFQGVITSKVEIISFYCSAKEDR